MAVEFRCNIEHDISTFTGVHHRVDEYKFSSNGSAYEKPWRSDSPGWKRIGSWSWDPVNHWIVVRTGEFTESGDEILKQYSEWSQAYKEHVESNLLT